MKDVKDVLVKCANCKTHKHPSEFPLRARDAYRWPVWCSSCAATIQPDPEYVRIRSAFTNSAAIEARRRVRDGKIKESEYDRFFLAEVERLYREYVSSGAS